MATRIPTASQNALANSVATLIDAGAGAGVVKIYTGAQPASANDAASGTLLATITLADPSFGAASAGVITALSVPRSVAAAASGDAGWYRCLDSNGATIIDGSVSATGGAGQLQLNTISLVSTVTVSITAWTITMPAT